MRSHLVVLVLCTLTLSRCQSSSTTNYPDEKIGRVFSIDTMGSAYSVRLFPKTYSATLSRSFSLVLVSPVLVKDEILYNSTSSSLIPWFNSRGVSVWLVKIPAHTRLDYFGTAVLPQIASSIQQNSTEENWVMGGVSLGGQAIAHYLQKADENATATGMRVDAVFFLGTGFDYAYPSSFARVLKDQLKSDDLCAQDFCSRYLPELAPRFAAKRSDLFDNAGKPVWSEAIDGSRLRGKKVRLFFISGKIDNVAPSESVYKFYTQVVGVPQNSPDYRFLQAGRMNRFAEDFNHTQLLGSDALASDILPVVLDWIND